MGAHQTRYEIAESVPVIYTSQSNETLEVPAGWGTHFILQGTTSTKDMPAPERVGQRIDFSADNAGAGVQVDFTASFDGTNSSATFVDGDMATFESFLDASGDAQWYLTFSNGPTLAP